MTKFEDSIGVISDSKQGFYQVGEKYYNKKFNALVESSKTKLPINWNFNYDVFQKAINAPRLPLSLDDLYVARAKQLREQYDYLILGFSGGSDSDNILKTFVSNNIKLDEVWTDFPLKLLDRSNYTVNYSTDATNMASEWFLVIKPELEKLAVTNPEIKIHISDSFEDPTVEDFEDTVTIMSVPSVYTSIKRYRYIEKYLNNLSLSGKKAALILGMDKPIVYLWKNSYGFYFVDTSIYFKSNLTQTVNSTVEYFYWTPDFPEIVVEQAKRVWEYLLLNPEFTKQKASEHQSEDNGWQIRTKGFDSVIKQICYKNWDFSKHQVNKTKIYRNEQFLVHLNKFSNERALQSLNSNIHSMVQLLDPALVFENGIDLSDDTKRYFNFHKLGDVSW